MGTGHTSYSSEQKCQNIYIFKMECLASNVAIHAPLPSLHKGLVAIVCILQCNSPLHDETGSTVGISLRPCTTKRASET